MTSKYSWHLAGVSMTLFRSRTVAFAVQDSLLDPESRSPCGNCEPCQHWPEVRRHGRGIPWAGGDPCMTGCLECPLAWPVLAQVQLGPRYEGQLNPMAEPIPHEVRPLVRTHVYHPYHAADRQAETDSWV